MDDSPMVLFVGTAFAAIGGFFLCKKRVPLGQELAGVREALLNHQQMPGPPRNRKKGLGKLIRQ